MYNILLSHLLNVNLEGGTGFDDQILGEIVGVFALGFVRVDDVDEDDIQKFVGHLEIQEVLNAVKQLLTACTTCSQQRMSSQL